MKEMVVVSGKGGTGKTSLTASFAVLAGRKMVFADCDVDGADMHLVLDPEIRETHPFVGGRVAHIDPGRCGVCGACLSLCRFGAVRHREIGKGQFRVWVDPAVCEGCGVCVYFCPRGAVEFPERVSGKWMVSQTRAGTLVHARLDPGGENSGKLVTAVREAARSAAERETAGAVLIDGPPGIGCPAIAALTGASLALIVTEPTPAGLHDLKRILALTKRFSLPVMVCVNKWDLDAGLCEAIETFAAAQGAALAGRVRFDPEVSAAQTAGRAVVETTAVSAGDIRAVWQAVREALGAAADNMTKKENAS